MDRVEVIRNQKIHDTKAELRETMHQIKEMQMKEEKEDLRLAEIKEALSKDRNQVFNKEIKKRKNAKNFIDAQDDFMSTTLPMKLKD